MTQDIDIVYNRVRAIRALRKALAREKECYVSMLRNRYGFGLNIKEFDDIVDEIVKNKWCFLKTGLNGALKLVFNEAHNNVVGGQD